MNPLTRLQMTRLWAILIMLILGVGCGKKDSAANASQSPVQTEAPAAATPATAAGPTRPSPAELAAQQAMAEQARQAEAAARAREYEQAVDALLAMQREQARRATLSEQQAAQYWRQMQRLQADIAAAAASGDPRAKAAADRLRRSATYR